jgi:hypothetical protein
MWSTFHSQYIEILEYYFTTYYNIYEISSRLG